MYSLPDNLKPVNVHVDRLTRYSDYVEASIDGCRISMEYEFDHKGRDEFGPASREELAADLVRDYIADLILKNRDGITNDDVFTDSTKPVTGAYEAQTLHIYFGNQTNLVVKHGNGIHSMEDIAFPTDVFNRKVFVLPGVDLDTKAGLCGWYGLAIEFGAWFWHKNRLDHDEEKQQLCKKRGIKLLTILECCPESIDSQLANKYLIYNNEISMVKLRDMITGEEDIYKGMGRNIADAFSSFAYNVEHNTPKSDNMDRYLHKLDIFINEIVNESKVLDHYEKHPLDADEQRTRLFTEVSRAVYPSSSVDSVSALHSFMDCGFTISEMKGKCWRLPFASELQFVLADPDHDTTIIEHEGTHLFSIDNTYMEFHATDFCHEISKDGMHSISFLVHDKHCNSQMTLDGYGSTLLDA